MSKKKSRTPEGYIAHHDAPDYWEIVGRDEAELLPDDTVVISSPGSREVLTHGDVGVTPEHVADNHELAARIREKNRAAGRRRWEDRSTASDEEIRRAAMAYRTTHPHSREHSTRRLALHIARSLSLSSEAVRYRLRALEIH